MSKLGDRMGSAVGRLHDIVGRDVTIVNPTDPTRDPDHNDVRFQDENRTTTVAEILESGSAAFQNRADGISEDTDAMALVKDSETVTSGSDDQTTAATRIEDGGTTYVVRGTFEEDNGLILCHCHRES